MADAAAIANLQNSIALTCCLWRAICNRDGLRHGRTPAALLDDSGRISEQRGNRSRRPSRLRA
jgi:hypothetical protein